MSLRSRSSLCVVATLVASAALAGTPAFVENLDGRTFPGGRVPNTFPAQIGTAYVYAPAGARIVPDPTCDALSTDVMELDSTTARGGWDVRFVHQSGTTGAAIAEQELMAIKVGQEQTNVWGTQVGFASTDGFEVFPVQLGPALAADADQSLGRVYVFGAPTALRYGNVYASQCTGVQQVNNQVNVTFALYGLDRQYFVIVQSFGPTPQQVRMGPYDLPAQFDTGYGACMIRSMAGTGRSIVDGVECIAATVTEIDPITHDNQTSREPARRRR
jgi:hypothetical protein